MISFKTILNTYYYLIINYNNNVNNNNILIFIIFEFLYDNIEKIHNLKQVSIRMF